MTAELEIVWRCRDGVALIPGAGGTVTLTIETQSRLDLRPPPSVAEALLKLQDGADEASLCRAVGQDGQALAVLFHNLGSLRRHGLLVVDLRSQGELLATLVPGSRSFELTPPKKAQGPWRLSRFSYLHLDGNDLVLGCPEARCSVRVKSETVADWLYKARLAVTPPPDSLHARILTLFGELGFLVSPEEPESEAERTWEFHDRLFHSRARHHDECLPHGGTYRFRDAFPSPSAIRPAHPGETLALPLPGPSPSRPLREVMEARRSRREMAATPVTLDQVAELLHRVARVRETRPTPLQDYLMRPYPSGGAIHELEFYLAVDACDGLANGFYHYRGAEHALTRLAGGDAPARDMLGDAAAAWAQPDCPPQCLVVLATRLPRIAWKYEGIAYKISLMNAGVVLQSLHLVCTDLGLNGSAVGSGRPHLFEAATHTSSWEETSIAEFGFGTRPPLA